ncbi:DNRLRE domain-containing protein [Pseudomonas benzenivorans]|uniref:DNRLRE domain-containing protein n=1 Tax=Pseudomonas benzenivorans TaxID=556533 RepID=A0ABY5H4V6_9PSED|nr:DNRLRE domain-containing protein [Pseudomonas benzenivorans]UTW07133.1 DNRLRE domain-containing protein [Pseudomonas benzenivorans]
MKGASRPRRGGQKGYVLLVVMVTLTLVAAIALQLSRQSGLEAAMVRGEAATTQVRYVAEAGLNHGLWRLDQLGCSADPSLGATAFGGHSYSVSVTPTSGSPVTLSASAALAGGASLSIRRERQRRYAPPGSPLVLQPNAAQGKDTFLYQWKPVWNYGGSGNLDAGDNGWDSTWRALLQFDLSAIPASARIVSATLALYQNNPSMSPGRLGVRRIRTAWTEGSNNGASGSGATWSESAPGVPWATAGGDLDGSAFASTQMTNTVGWFSWDIGKLVAGWVAGEYPNHGLALVHETPWAAGRFSSSDASDPAQRPKLTVTYACECGQSCGALAVPKPGVLLVVPDPAAPDAQDSARKALIESFNYSVRLIDDDAPHFTFDQALTDVRAIYVSLQSNSAGLGTRLRNASVGIVNEHGGLAADLGLSANSNVTAARNSINVLDNSHYLTSPFAIASTIITRSNQPMIILGGQKAPGLIILADALPSTSAQILSLVDSGGGLYGGGTAPARRVQLPWGAPGFDIKALDSNGEGLMRRAVEWAAGMDTKLPAGGSQVMLIVASDTYIRESSISSYGSSSSLSVGRSNGQGHNMHSLLRFDLSTLPPGSRINSATLRLFAGARNGAEPFSIKAHRMTQTWEAEAATWTNANAATNWSGGPGGSYAPTAVATLAATGTGWYQWNLAPLVQEWVDGLSPNQGVGLIHTAVSSNNRVDFHSLEGASRPQLVIEYSPP